MDAMKRAAPQVVIHQLTGLTGVKSYRNFYPLAASINEEKDTIEDVYEPFLLQSGYLKRTPRGRTATLLAYRHLQRQPQAEEQPRLL